MHEARSCATQLGHCSSPQANEVLQEAVDVALQHEDVTLAKRSACKPHLSQKRLRQKLWLRIVEHQARRAAIIQLLLFHGDLDLCGAVLTKATSCDVPKIIGLIRESQELTIRDVLPYLSDSMTIDAFKTEICDCLDSYEGLSSLVTSAK